MRKQQKSAGGRREVVVPSGRNQQAKNRRRAAHWGAAVGPRHFEELERRTLLAAAPVISEILASNSGNIVDGNGAHSDWIEIHNQGDASIDLSGWHLTDNPSQPSKWTFPSRVLGAGQYMIVFASGNNTTDPAGNLHTNFSLSADGENVSLRQPDGTVVSQLGANGAAYPKQVADVSYGPTSIQNVTTLIEKGAPAKAFVPINGSLDAGQWTAINYVDSSWKSGTTGVGFDGGGTASSADLIARWFAPSLGLADNATVSSWAAATGTGTASQSTSSKRPTYQSDAASRINGNAVVRFDGVNDNLLITNQSLNGDTSFTVALVFRTSTAGRAGTQWYNNSGIVDAEVGGVTNDWGVALNDAGQVGGGVGNPDSTLYSASGLANGQAHVAVFTKNGTQTSLSIDGGIPVYGTASASARTVNELVFGSLHTNINYFSGDIGEVRLYNAALSEDGIRSLGNEMSATWGVSPAAGVYTSQIGLDLQSEMSGVATTADIRVPFTVNNPSQFDTLLLNMKYDDGFVAYLNGTEVARRNAPGGAITYQSVSTGIRPDAAAQVAETIDISAFANLLVGNGATNVLAIKALNSSLADSDVLIIPELKAAVTTPIAAAYMTTPTPGAPNQPGYAGLASPVSFSVDRGYYSAPVTTTLTSSTLGSTLVYTLDGSTPTLTNGIIVLPANQNTAPTKTLTITSTTVVRAAAFKDAYLPSEVVAKSYFFVADIIHQPEGTPAGAYWDVGMDSDVVNASQTYSVAQALTAIPTISLSLPNADMFGPDGIYKNPLERGDEWERAVSVEYFDPNNVSDEFAINAGIRIQGGVSRDPSRPKKSFKLYFRSEYGTSKLSYPVFGASDAEQIFDHLVLRAGHSYSWANLGGTPAERADYLRDEFARDTQAALSGDSSSGKFVQLYINGQYWGLYNAVEEIDQDWAAAHYGGEPEDYDVIQPDNNGGVEADDGTIDAWNNLFNNADDAIANDGVVDAAEYASIASQVDTRQLVDYMLDIFYRGDNDAPVLIGSTTSPRNFIAVHNRNDPNGKFYFQSWDGEISMDDVFYDRTDVFGNQNPARLFQQLKTNPDFRQLVLDETYKAFYNGGKLTPAANQARYQSLMDEINVAIVGESARWGNAQQSTPMMRDTNWVTETNWILNTYMPARTNVVVAQLKNDFPELNTAAPVINVNGSPSQGGTISSGASITLTNSNASPAGTVYYTLDGTDPRASGGGGVSSTALTYTGAFTLSQGRRVLSRVLRSGVWSPLADATFVTDTPYPVRISEVHYHPANRAGVTDPEDMEFIELVNTSSQSVSMQGVTISQAFDYTFPAGVMLGAGARIVIARNPTVFQQVYGTGIMLAPGAGYSPQNLSNSGERILLTGPLGETLEDFTYDDAAPWPTSPDGDGPSLEMIDPSADPTNAANWRASAAVGGSPGTNGAVAPQVTGSGFGYQTGQTVSFTFDHDMNTSSFATNDLSVQRTSGGPTITPTSFTYTAATRTLTFAFASLLADGDYTATLGSGSVSDASGTPLGSSASVGFFVLAGDANRDRKVDIVDLGVLAGNWQGTNKTFGTGDFNYDGIVNIVDLGILATNWQKSLGAAPATSAAVPAQPAAQPVKSVTPTRASRLASDVLGDSTGAVI